MHNLRSDVFRAETCEKGSRGLWLPHYEVTRLARTASLAEVASGFYEAQKGSTGCRHTPQIPQAQGPGQTTCTYMWSGVSYSMLRDIHGEKHDHIGCPDYFCCMCDCTVCKRLWWAQGRRHPRECPEHGAEVRAQEEAQIPTRFDKIS